jgi:hypothetical protein
MSTTPNPLEQDALKGFQLTQDGIKEKSSKEFGLAISKKIYGTVQAGSGGYFFDRNARFAKNRNYANGRIDVQAMFQDRLQMNGKTNYISLNWRTLQIVNRIISGLVGRWMKRNEKIQVKAIDNLSQTDKQAEYDQIEFILDNRAKLEQLQQESGVEIIPQNQFIPSDREELNLWKHQFQRLPEEIACELDCNEVLISNGWFDVLKEKMLHDSAEVLFVGTYTWMDKEGVIHVEWVKPENAIYSYSEYPDFRDTSWRGQMPSRKISEIRKMWGKEFNPNNPFALDEKALWQLSQKCKEYQNSTNVTIWDDNWYASFLRPYDEWNIRTIEFELKTVDSEAHTFVTTKKNKSTLHMKGRPQKPSGNERVIEDTHWNIYRGVYIPDADLLVEWGLKDNMIRPQDPKEIGNCEFSYSFFMPQNYLMRNMAIPEKIEAAVDGMILALLKMQQVVSRMRPTGAAIDESALQNIDYGLGDSNKDIYYRGLDAEGNRVPIPIQELANSGFLGQMDGLIKNYQFNYQILKDELGEDPNLISAALQPRVTAGNVEASQLQAEYATDYIYNAYAECMKITARKVSCLIKDSVSYGAQAYRNLTKQDVDQRIFSTDIRFLPTEQEVLRFEAVMSEAMKSTPDLVLFIDPFQLIRVAKEDVKLAELLFRQGQKKMLLHQQMVAQQNQQQTIEGQIQAAQAAEKAKGENAAMELEAKGVIQQREALAQKEQIVLKMVGDLAAIMATPIPVSESGKAAKAQELSPELKELMKLSIQNIAIPLAIGTKEMINAEAQPQMAQQPIQEPQPELAA